MGRPSIVLAHGETGANPRCAAPRSAFERRTQARGSELRIAALLAQAPALRLGGLRSHGDPLAFTRGRSPSSVERGLDRAAEAVVAE